MLHMHTPDAEGYQPGEHVISNKAQAGGRIEDRRDKARANMFFSMNEPKA